MQQSAKLIITLKHKIIQNPFWFFCLGFICVMTIQIRSLASPPVNISVLMHAPEAAKWQPIVKQFEQQNPHIHLEIVEGPNQTDQIEELYTASFLLGNSPYDLVFMDVVWTGKLAAAGWLLDLSSRISHEELSVFLDGDVNASFYGGGLYRIPSRSDIGLLYYRTDLINSLEVKPPTTFTELIQIATRLQNRNLVDWGYVWQGKQYEGLAAMFVEVLKGYGAFWINPDTLEVGLDQPSAIAAVDFLRKTINQGISPPGVTTYTEEDTRLLFQNGKAVFLRNWPYAYPLMESEDSPIKGKFAIKPMVHTPNHPGGGCLGGWGLGIAKSSSHPEEAWEVVRFLTSEDVQRQFILSTGNIPSRKALFNDPEIVAKYPHYPQLLEVVNNAALRPPIAQYAQASDILQRYLSAALTNTMTAEQAMQAAAAETRRLLAMPKSMN